MKAMSSGRLQRDLRPDPRRDLPPWSGWIDGRKAPGPAADGRYRIGVLPGEGIGPEVIGAALTVLRALESAGSLRFSIVTGGKIGGLAERRCGSTLSDEVVAFCDEIFASGGAVLAGPGGGRFVYDLRRRFDLYCKLSPLIPRANLIDSSRLKREVVEAVDCLIVRDNAAGVYQGSWRESVDAERGRVAHHEFSYSEYDVRRIVDAAARIAARRRRRLTIVLKDGGVPAISALWRGVGGEVAAALDVATEFINVDYAAYRLVHEPRRFDVIVTSNLFGDLLIDLGGVVAGSRGVTFSGNFAPGRAAVYQTNHGAAHDLAGSDRANPIGQIDSLAMLLRESFGLARAAQVIEAAVDEVLAAGWRTDDLAHSGCRRSGTREFGARVAECTARLGQAQQLG